MNKFKKNGLVLLILAILLQVLLMYAKNYGNLIVIDPGHGGKDPGSIGQEGLYEKDINLAVAKKLNRRLRLRGYRTLMTRKTDSYLEPMARAQQANEKDGFIFISLHANALENNSQVTGLQVLHYPDANLDMAQTFMDCLVEKTGAGDRGLVARGDLIVLNQTRMPAVLVELGFLSNPLEEALLGDPGYQKKLAAGLAQAIDREIKKRK